MPSNILYNKKPLVVNPELAKLIGLNESIIVQQLNYWIEDVNKTKGKNSINYKDGYYWAFNTYKEWKENNFPFWSISTIRRIINKLEKEEIIITDNFNKLKIDKTKWYRINHKKLDELWNDTCVQSEQSTCSECTDQASNMNKAIPEITTETNNRDNIRDIDEIWEHYKRAVKDADYNPQVLTDKRKYKIKKLFKYFTLDDIKKSINNATNHKFMMGDNPDNKFHLKFNKMMTLDTIEEYLNYKNGKQQFEEVDYYADLK